MEIKLRPEEEKDYRRVEKITREAFWNLYVPGCDEHLLVNRLRKSEQFVRELDFVALHEDGIVGNILYVETKIISEDNREHKVLTFGPVTVLPGYQNKGIGTKLILHTVQLAKTMGYKAILIYGYPGYYERFGFKASKEYQITNQEGKFPAALQVLELYPGALTEIKGVFDKGDIYSVDPGELERFENEFPPKEKSVTKSQERFMEMANKFL